MRVTTAQTFDASVDTLQRRQHDLVEAQQRLTSGKRVLRASDDPSAAARAERALASVARSDADQRAIEASRNAMTLTESALGDANELLQQARETLLAAGNASYSDGERASLAAKLEQLRAQLLAVANRSAGAGAYVFGGQGFAGPPFVETATGVEYRGAGGSLLGAGTEPLPLSVDGEAAWLLARSGNGSFVTGVVASTTAWIDPGHVADPAALTGANYEIAFGNGSYSVSRDGAPLAGHQDVPFVAGTAITVDGMAFRVGGAPAPGDRFAIAPSTPGLDVFKVLDDAVAELRVPLRSRAEVMQTVTRGVRDLDASLGALQGLRATVGELLNRADNAEDRVAATRLHGQIDRSHAEDLDMVQAISEFQNRHTGYEAALKTYSMVQRLSLFQYLGS